MRRRFPRRRGLGLIEVLVVLVVIALLALVVIPRVTTGGRDETGARRAAPRERARQAQGVSYTQQINLAIQMYRDDNDGKNPPSLADLKPYKVTEEMIVDPVTRRPLPYDPETGAVGGGGAALPRANGF